MKNFKMERRFENLSLFNFALFTFLALFPQGCLKRLLFLNEKMKE